MRENGNFIRRFIDNAQRHPNKIALQLPYMKGQKCLAEESISYGDLSRLVSAYQLLWQQQDWQSGDRVIVILKPSKALYAIALSLFSLGIVAVFIDTGMGRKKIKMAIQDSHAKAIISLQALVKLFWLIPPLWPLQRFAIDGNGLGYKNLQQQVSQLMPSTATTTENASITTGGVLTCVARNNTDHGLISFTSGSTGRPKGADRTHFSLIQQHLAIREHWPDDVDDIDCPCFPVMVLHNLSCGMTTIMPKVDLAQPSQVNAAVVIAQIRQHKISRLSGAPAYIEGLVNYLDQQVDELNTVSEVKSIVVGGATVSKSLARSIRRAFPLADARIVYGSTEAEPISDVTIDEYLAEEQAGYLVGHIAPQIDLLIAPVDDLAQQGLLITEKNLLQHACDTAEIGEILVSGHHVLKQYIDNPDANRENKIPRSNVEATKSVWHRTGDCGYQDKQGRLWLSGRTKDVIRFEGHALQPYPIEQQLDQDKAIQRAAIINNDDQVYLFVQLKPVELATESAINVTNQEALITRISAIATAYFLPLGLRQMHYSAIAKMPVDGRHNSKIDRPLLRELLTKNKIAKSQLLTL
jgi:acyl-CoA synthetase (AMP-forming)/AMP-acid ligase II